VSCPPSQDLLSDDWVATTTILSDRSLLTPSSLQSRVSGFVQSVITFDRNAQRYPRGLVPSAPDRCPLARCLALASGFVDTHAGFFRDGGDHAPALRELVDILARGLKEAAPIGELLLKGRSLAIWRKALSKGPPGALDVTLISLRQRLFFFAVEFCDNLMFCRRAALDKLCERLLDANARSTSRTRSQSSSVPIRSEE
jgi:hypothetical protein